MLGMPMNVPVFDMNTGMNYASPTIANMGGMGYPIPPYPMGMANIGGIGYNQQQGMIPPFTGGYIVQQPPMNQYGGYGYYYQDPYYRSMSPYAYQKYQQAQQAAYKEQMRSQSDIAKSLAKNALRAAGKYEEYPDLDARLDKAYNPFPQLTEEQQELQTEIQRYNGLMTRSANAINPVLVRAAQAQQVTDQYKKSYPDDMCLIDFLGKAGEIYIDKINDDINKARLNGKMQYDTDQYKRLLNAHQESSEYFNSILTGSKNIHIDDMEIQLPTNAGERPSIVVNMPDHMKSYAENKQRFLNHILSKMGG